MNKENQAHLEIIDQVRELTTTLGHFGWTFKELVSPRGTTDWVLVVDPPDGPTVRRMFESLKDVAEWLECSIPRVTTGFDDELIPDIPDPEVDSLEHSTGGYLQAERCFADSITAKATDEELDAMLKAWDENPPETLLSEIMMDSAVDEVNRRGAPAIKVHFTATEATGARDILAEGDLLLHGGTVFADWCWNPPTANDGFKIWTTALKLHRSGDVYNTTIHLTDSNITATVALSR